ncbi:MAG: matrixin family metalloprotease [Actinobacteria bacterium]|nr:matrixin family metalloprotease [Actinomycetota bacterium]
MRRLLATVTALAATTGALAAAGGSSDSIQPASRSRAVETAAATGMPAPLGAGITSGSTSASGAPAPTTPGSSDASAEGAADDGPQGPTGVTPAQEAAEERAAARTEVVTVFKEYVPTDGQTDGQTDAPTGGLAGRARRAAGGGAGSGSGGGGARCANDGAHSNIAWGGVREARPWRAPEDIRFQGDDAPVSFDWRSEILGGSDVWETGANDCDVPDSVGWITPGVGPDSAAALSLNCTAMRDNANTVGWLSFNNDGLLAYACVWSSGGWIHEGDILFNSDMKWCDGLCADGYDLRSVAAHEWGHYLGLGHTCGESDLPSCDDTNAQAAVMFPFLSGNDTTNRTLSAGDVAGAEALYPAEHDYEIVGVDLVNPYAPDRLTPGHEYTVNVDLKNAGLAPWSTGDGGPTLTTGAPSEQQGSDWLSATAATHLDEDLTRDSTSGGRIRNDDATVIRGEAGRYTFNVKIPTSLEGEDASTDVFDLALGAPLGAPFGGPSIAAGLPVGNFAPTVRGVAQVPVVVQGAETTEVWVEVRNDGDMPWFIDETVTVAAAAGSSARCSTFRGSDWADCTLASWLDVNVSDPRNPTAPVLPGEDGRFKFHFSSPEDLTLIGPHTETLKPRLGATGRLAGGPAIFEFVVV